MLTRYAELAPISAVIPNTTSSRIRSRGPTAFTYFFFGNGVGIDPTELIVVDMANHPGRSDTLVRHPSCATAGPAVLDQINIWDGSKPRRWINPPDMRIREERKSLARNKSRVHFRQNSLTDFSLRILHIHARPRHWRHRPILLPALRPVAWRLVMHPRHLLRPKARL